MHASAIRVGNVEGDSERWIYALNVTEQRDPIDSLIHKLDLVFKQPIRSSPNSQALVSVGPKRRFRTQTPGCWQG